MVRGQVGSLTTFNGQGDADSVYVAEAVWREELCLGFGLGGCDTHGYGKHSCPLLARS